MRHFHFIASCITAVGVPVIYRIIFAFAVAWAIAMVFSIALPLLTEPAGDGFTRGLNRLVAFAGWQTLALIFAVGASIAFAASPKPRPRVIKIAGLIPIAISAIMVVIVIGTIMWARSTAPAPENAGPPAVPTIQTPAAAQ